MAIEPQISVLGAILVGIFIGIGWGLRKIMVLERLIYELDMKIEHILESVKRDERAIKKKMLKK